MPRGTDLSEAQRRLTQSQTLFKRMCNKHKEAEEEYIRKIERQQAEYDALVAESK